LSSQAPIPGPALALLELESIARGFIAADALVKRAPVQLVQAEAITPGKYLLLFSGGVAEVEEAFAAGVEAAGTTLLDRLLLPYADEALLRALSGHFHSGLEESVGVVETHTVAAALLAADKALKGAEVRLIQLQLARGIGGKGYFTLTGPLHMVEAALAIVSLAVTPPLLLATELLQSPHPDLKGRLL